MTLIWILLALAVVVLLVSFGCYRFAFYAADRKPLPVDAIELPEGKIYEPYREVMTRWIKEARAMNPEAVEITSFDGLKLQGKFYEYGLGSIGFPNRIQRSARIGGVVTTGLIACIGGG